MILFGSAFLANVHVLRSVAIVGGNGSGKDLLACEIAERYLKQGYRFCTNQRSIWNDELYYERVLSENEIAELRNRFVIRDRDVYVRDVVSMQWYRDLFGEDVRDIITEKKMKAEDLEDIRARYLRSESGEVVERVADTNHMVLVMSEAGRYLRRWVYFEDLVEFKRKGDNILLMPSLRLPHVDLCEMVCMCNFTFRDVIGYPAGVWTWYITGQGLVKPVQGYFLFWPERMGVYDTDDYSTSPTETIDWFKRNIDRLVREQGRAGLSSLASGSSANEQDDLASIAQKVEGAAFSLSKKKR